MNLEAGHAGRDLNAGRVCRSWRGSHTFDIHVEIHSTKSRGLRSQHNHVFIKISELHDQDAKWQGVLPWGPNCIDSLEGKCEWSVPNSRRVSWIGLWSVPEFYSAWSWPSLGVGFLIRFLNFRIWILDFVFSVPARGESSTRQNFQAKPNIQTQSWHRTLSLEHARWQR